MISLLIGVLVAIVLAIVWRFLWLTNNQRRALRALRWVDLALAGEGHVTGMEPISPHRFRVSVTLGANVFERASMLMELAPRHDPVEWLIFCLKKKNETLTFQADLGSAPAFNFEGINERWYGKTRPSLNPQRGDWEFEQWSPCVLTTTSEWRSELAATLNALFLSRSQDVSSVKLSARSPQFSATLPLDSVIAAADQRPSFFDSLREMASEASAFRS